MIMLGLRQTACVSIPAPSQDTQKRRVTGDSTSLPPQRLHRQLLELLASRITFTGTGVLEKFYRWFTLAHTRDHSDKIPTLWVFRDSRPPNLVLFQALDLLSTILRLFGIQGNAFPHYKYSQSLPIPSQSQTCLNTYIFRGNFKAVAIKLVRHFSSHIHQLQTSLRLGLSFCCFPIQPHLLVYQRCTR